MGLRAFLSHLIAILEKHLHLQGVHIHLIEAFFHRGIEDLVRRIRQAHPNFQFKKLRVKWQLSDDNKQQRVTICQTLLQHFRALLHRVVFVDAKTVWMWEEEVWGWVDTSVPNYSQGIKPAYNQGRIIWLK